MAGVLALAMFATFAGTAHAPTVARQQAEPSLRAQFAVIRSNAAFRWLLVFSCAQMLAVGLMLAAAPYFATYTLGDPGAVTPLFVFLVGPIIVTMPAWTRFRRRRLPRPRRGRRHPVARARRHHRARPEPLRLRGACDRGLL